MDNASWLIPWWLLVQARCRFCDVDDKAGVGEGVVALSACSHGVVICCSSSIGILLQVCIVDVVVRDHDDEGLKLL